MTIPNSVAIVISICLMAVTIIASARLILRVSPTPYWQALLIAAVSNLLGKLFVSVMHWQGGVSYSLPTLAFLILSYLFFKPSLPNLLLYWVVGFAFYLLIHLVITALFNWTFMFPFWAPKLFG